MDDRIQGRVWDPTLAELERLWCVGERAAYAVLRSGVHASDAADEALRRLWAEPWQEQQHRERVAWMWTTAHNIALDFQRTRKHTTESVDPAHLDGRPQDDGPDHAALALWRARLADLEPLLRQMLRPLAAKVLTRVLANMETTQIAAELSRPEAEIRRLRRGIIRLARKML